MAIRPPRMHPGSGGLAAPALRFLLGLTLLINQAPAQAGGTVYVERFNCGRLGPVVLSSADRSFLQAGHAVIPAQIQLLRRGIRQKGVVHTMMGGNDRIFTRSALDNVRSPDATSTVNPVILRILGDGVVYGKQRQEISLALLREAYTCIPS